MNSLCKAVNLLVGLEGPSVDLHLAYLSSVLSVGAVMGPVQDRGAPDLGLFMEECTLFVALGLVNLLSPFKQNPLLVHT